MTPPNNQVMCLYFRFSLFFFSSESSSSSFFWNKSYYRVVIYDMTWIQIYDNVTHLYTCGIYVAVTGAEKQHFSSFYNVYYKNTIYTPTGR